MANFIAPITLTVLWPCSAFHSLRCGRHKVVCISETESN